MVASPTSAAVVLPTLPLTRQQASDETDTVSVAAGAFADGVGQTNTASSSKNLAVGGLVENYGNYYSAFGATEVITGTSSRDELTFGDDTAYDGGNLTINGQGGDDVRSLGSGDMTHTTWTASSRPITAETATRLTYWGLPGVIRQLLDHCWRRQPDLLYW